MENMKRAISAFMALVLVLGMLPGVPMFAGAEEVEIQPETIAVETTEVVTVPEETEAPETTEAPEEAEPETTEAAETVPEETVPETTAAQETIPEETVAEEVIPEETVSEEVVPVETIPEETVAEEFIPEETVSVEIQEEIADAEAVDGEVITQKLVEKIVVSADTKRTYVGNRVQLKAEVTPADAEYPDVEFYVVDGDAEYDAQLLAEKGILIAESAGTLTVAAKAKDKGAHDSAEQEKDGTVQVTFVDYAMKINKEDIAAKNWYDADEDGTDETVRIQIDESVTLSVHFLVNGQVELPLVTPNVKWSLASGDEKYATLTPSEDGKEVTVKGKTVTETKYITLYAEDSLAGKDSIELAVYPVPYKVGVYNGEKEVSGETITVPILASSFEDPEFEYYELDLTAQVWPKEAEEPVTWTCSDNLVIVKHPIKEGTEKEEDTTKATVRVYPYEGSSTITITSKNYPEIKTKITIKRKWCLEQNDICFSAATERLETQRKGLVSGESFQLEVLDCRNANKMELLDSSVVKWSLSEEDQAYASLSKEGELTARKNIVSGKEITVRCSVIGNEENAYLELPVIIRPLATDVRILPGDLADADLPETEILNDSTIAVNTAGGRSPFALDFEVWPVNDGEGAKQDVKWTSSNTAIAAIDKDTEKIVWKGKNGTVTITATAADGSGKKASVKLKFGAQIQKIEILEENENFFLRSGQSWTFDVKFTPAKPTETGLTWALVGANDSKYASISSSGKLTAKTVYENHYVTVVATAKDGSGVSSEPLQVLIKPKNDGILTLKGYNEYVTTENNYVTKTTQIIPVGSSIDLQAFVLGESDEEFSKWKVSSTKTAELSDTYGGSTTVTMLKAGTVTVTATSQNDTKKKATVTLKGVRMTDSIEWTHTHEQTELACGKSLTLKAKAYDAEGKTPTVSKLAWSIAPGGQKYAKVSSSGKVTAIAGALTPYDEPVDITVVVKATDGSGVQEEYDITIHPIAQSVLISLTNEEGSEINVTGRTYTVVMENPGEDTIQLDAQVWSENAIQGVTWKSSNSKTASIDKESGEITCKKAGTVTITATSGDGSGKKATFKLTIVLRPTGVYFDKLNYAVVAGGKSLKLKPVLLDGNGNKITGKKLEWKVVPCDGDTSEDGTAFVTSISGGTLKTKKVTEHKRVKVILRTQEKNNAWEFEYDGLIVDIYPATGSVQILNAAGADVGRTMWAPLSDGGLDLNAVTKSKVGDGAFPGVTWKSSNTKIATVDAFTGQVTFKKAGKVTIYAYAGDGTGVKDSVSLTIRN